jgi:hypothetical protein
MSLAGVGFKLSTSEGVQVAGFNTFMTHPASFKLPEAGHIRFKIAAKQLTPGAYFVSVVANSHLKHVDDYIESAIGLTIHPADIHGAGYLLTRDDGLAVLDVVAEIESK